ncbi:hypothetical protein [Mariniluteicoccus flavus]
MPLDDRSLRALDWYRSFNLLGGRRVNDPATHDAIAKARAFTQVKFGVPVPQDLFDVWSVCNGFGGNGFTFWSIHEITGHPYNDGYIESNMIVQAPPGLLLLGTCGDEYLAYDPLTGQLPLVDGVSRDVRKFFPNITLAIEHIICPNYSEDL